VDVVYSRCAGLDIHKKPVVACVIVPGTKGKPHKTIRTFGTMTDELLALGDWLAAEEVTHVAMECREHADGVRLRVGRVNAAS